MAVDYASTGKVTKPVVEIAVAKYVGAPGIKEVGKLCVCSNINKWSKYKPFKDVEKRLRFLQDEDATKTDRDVAMRSNDGRIWGLSIEGVQSSALCDAMTLYGMAQANGSGYGYPKANGVTEPKRLNDFIGYRHDAAQMCESFNMRKGSIETRYVSTGTETLELEFLVSADASKAGGNVTMGLLEAAVASGTMVLSAHVYKKVGSAYTLIETFIGDGIRLMPSSSAEGSQYDTSQRTIGSDWNGGDNFRKVKVVFDADTYWKASTPINQVWVVLAFDWVGKKQPQTGVFHWYSTRRVVVPFETDEHWYVKQVNIYTAARTFQPKKVLNYIDGETGWYDYYTPVHKDRFQNTRVMFEVSKDLTEDLTFNQTDCYLIAKYNGGVDRKGCVIDPTTYNKLTSKSVGTGNPTTTTEVYFEFDGLFAEVENPVSGVGYQCQLQLYKQGVRSELGSFSVVYK